MSLRKFQAIEPSRPTGCLPFLDQTGKDEERLFPVFLPERCGKIKGRVLAEVPHHGLYVIKGDRLLLFYGDLDLLELVADLLEIVAEGLPEILRRIALEGQAACLRPSLDPGHDLAVQERKEPRHRAVGLHRRGHGFFIIPSLVREHHQAGAGRRVVEIGDSSSRSAALNASISFAITSRFSDMNGRVWQRFTISEAEFLAVQRIEIEVPGARINDLVDDQVDRLLDQELFLTVEQIEGKDLSLF